MRDIYFLATWYTALVCTLVIALLFFFHLNFPHPSHDNLKPHYQSYKALPLTAYVINQEARITYQEASPKK